MNIRPRTANAAPRAARNRLASPSEWRREWGLLRRRDFWVEFLFAAQRDRLTGMAAETAFYMLFALFPFLLFAAALAGWVIRAPDLALEQRAAILEWLVPRGTAHVLTGFLQGPLQKSGPLASGMGMLATAWAGSQGFAALLHGLNRVLCAKEPRSWWRVRSVSLLMMLPAAGALGVVTLLLAAPGPRGGVGELPDWLMTLWSVLRWPLLGLWTAFMMGCVYTAVPCITRRAHWITAGAMVASVLWVVASAGLTIFVARSDPSRMYGSLADIMMLALWIYAGVLAVLAGAEVDALLLRREPRAA